MSETHSFFAWADIFKLVAGFAISLFLIWAKSEGERLMRIRTLKRSAWNVAKHHTDYRELIQDLRSNASCANEGKVWISSTDLSTHYSAIVSELSSLDSKNSEIYVSYLSAEDVVRYGYDQLSKLKLEFVKARSHAPALPNETLSLRSAIQAQCLAISNDLCVMAKQELDVLKLIKIDRAASIDPVKQLEEAIESLEKSQLP